MKRTILTPEEQVETPIRGHVRMILSEEIANHVREAVDDNTSPEACREGFAKVEALEAVLERIENEVRPNENVQLAELQGERSA